MPDERMLRLFRENGGDGPAQGGLKVCHAATEDDGWNTAFRLWPNMMVPGELSQVLPTPRHFEQASQLVTQQMIAESLPAGPDPKPYLDAIQSYVDAGFDEVYLAQIGPDQDAFFGFWARELAPRLREPAMAR